MNNIILKYAIIIGLINIGLCTVSYSMGMSYFNELAPNITWASVFPFFFFIVYVLGATMAVLEAKRKNGGYLNYRSAFQVIFLSMFFGSLMTVAYSSLLVTVIDPGYQNLLKKGYIELLMNTKEQMLKLMDEDKFMKSIHELENQNFGLSAQLQGLIMKSIYYAAISFIMAFIFKKNNLEENANEY